MDTEDEVDCFELATAWVAVFGGGDDAFEAILYACCESQPDCINLEPVEIGG